MLQVCCRALQSVVVCDDDKDDRDDVDDEMPDMDQVCCSVVQYVAVQDAQYRSSVLQVCCSARSPI